MKVISESVIREVVGMTRLEDLLTVSRQSVERDSRSLLQELLDEYEVGILIQSIQLQDVNPPSQVIDAFDDVQKARQDKERTVNQAEAYRNTIVPEARGEAEKILQEAEGYKNKLIKQAEGEASRFTQVLKTYQQAKDTTKKRIYLETLRDVLFMSCTCGRSPTGKCVGWHNLSEEEYQLKKIVWESKQKSAQDAA